MAPRPTGRAGPSPREAVLPAAGDPGPPDGKRDTKGRHPQGRGHPRSQPAIDVPTNTCTYGPCPPGSRRNGGFDIPVRALTAYQVSASQGYGITDCVGERWIRARSVPSKPGASAMGPL